ncbi:MAG: hypothetical protein EXR62_14730 [Chloroflexi bacterium]|nr:hypothetical protein [Chloroflexota bacterium]
MLQSCPGVADDEFGGGAEVGAGKEAVSRRFEFYKYTGMYDPDVGGINEAMCDNPLAPGQQTPDRCGAPNSDGVAGVGDMIGAQNMAVNLAGVFANSPTTVTLASFVAAADQGGVLVSWETASEVGVLGFNVWRSMSPGSNYVKLNPQVIAAQGGSGGRYSYFDATAQPGQANYYRLEMVILDGSSQWAGPAAVTLPQAVVFLPWISR